MSESPESWPDVYETVLKSDIAEYQQTITSIRNQLAEAQKTNERLLQQQIEQRRKLGAEADDWKLKFDNAVKYATEREQERDQLNQKLAALTEALKPVRIDLQKIEAFTNVEGSVVHQIAQRALSELDKLCAKGD